MYKTKVLFIMLVLGLILTGCSFNASNSKNDSGPISGQNTTLEVMIVSNDETVKNIEENKFTKWYEAKTGVKIKWIKIPDDKNAVEKVDMTLLSNSCPDVVFNLGLTDAQVYSYAKEGIFIPLNDLINKSAKNIKKVVLDNHEIYSSICFQDGKIYSLPSVDEYNYDTTSTMWINQDWLEKINKPVPTTTEELYWVLKAFRDTDLNNNGQKDEIPLISYTKSGQTRRSDTHFSNFLINAYIYKPLESDLYIDNGKVVFVADKPEYREALKYMIFLYNELLIAPESFTLDKEKLVSKYFGKEVQYIGAIVGEHPAILTNSGDLSKYRYVLVPPLAGPSGVRQAPPKKPVIKRNQFMITKKCKSPEIALKWIDWLYSDEGALNSNIGVEGEAWKKVSGKTSLSGSDAKWEKISNNSAGDASSWMKKAGPYYLSKTLFLSRAGEQTSPESFVYKELEEKYKPYIKDAVFPSYVADNELTEYLSKTNAKITDIVDHAESKFISGAWGIVALWDPYLKELNDAGLNDYINKSQEYYDKHKAK